MSTAPSQIELTSWTPVEVDTALADIYGRYHAVLNRIPRAKMIREYEDGVAKFAAGDRRYSSYSQKRLDQLHAERDRLLAEARNVMADAAPYDAEFDRRGGWTRFFLVRNNGGHIHSSMSCSTCFPTTEFGWLPDQSGQTEAEAVAVHGAILCTVCYPTAPVEWTRGREAPADQCPGSGTWDYPHDLEAVTAKKVRLGYVSGNYGTCRHCGDRVTITTTGKMRKHKKVAAK